MGGIMTPPPSRSALRDALGISIAPDAPRLSRKPHQFTKFLRYFEISPAHAQAGDAREFPRDHTVDLKAARPPPARPARSSAATLRALPDHMESCDR